MGGCSSRETQRGRYENAFCLLARRVKSQSSLTYRLHMEKLQSLNSIHRINSSFLAALNSDCLSYKLNPYKTNPTLAQLPLPKSASRTPSTRTPISEIHANWPPK